MKKLFSILLLSCISTYAFAGQVSLHSDKSQFAPVNWKSENPYDKVMITNATGMDKQVIIFVQPIGAVPGVYSTGANVQGCGEIKHITPGSAAICRLGSTENNVIILTSDANDFSAGTFQVE